MGPRLRRGISMLLDRIECGEPGRNPAGRFVHFGCNHCAADELHSSDNGRDEKGRFLHDGLRLCGVPRTLGVVKPRGLKNGPCAERRGLDTSQPDDACRAGIETVTKHHFFPFISTWETPP